MREVVDSRLKSAKNGDGILETVNVEWRNQQKAIPVITMPTSLLSYNPLTHRIRAQRTLDPARNSELERDPYGDSAQRYLHALLAGDPMDPSKEDPTFAALKQDLKDHGQTDPGIITEDGVLINGNTRCAALRDLNEEHIRVGVLPPDAGLDDLQSIELSLQLRKDLKRDYSFMNFLLAIDERRAAGRPAAEIQKDFRIKATTFERSVWILNFIEDVIERSRVKTAGGEEASLHLIDFEGDQGKLEELYRTYKSRKIKAADEAEALREQRLLALILDKSKTDLRLIDHDFADLYLKNIVPQDPPSSEPKRTIPGTSIPAPAPSAKVQVLREFTTKVLRAKAIEKAGATVTPNELAEAGESLASTRAAVNEALDKAGKTGRVVKKRFGPGERLSDANDNLQLCIEAVAGARATANFRAEDLDDELAALRTNLLKLSQLVSRGADSDTDGVNWLVQVARLPHAGS
ncbi:hypothetical protein C6A87_004450 [Mycobacterium sp. ITM-2016-00317]|uniref:hypothetical protein n=1 Tax=Mycobacterium sp. ITM-2016-00317 TaxID=2099694 RepID=UPI00287F9648|nr:hypothetical protein [Mycobacterium sp. ITM-2016-00317]WNG88498.1 hypothetical protein C6A87_004450 [Mycobacterium sp. ITM-2016-00317]